MNVRCPECSTIYRVDPAKVPAGGIRARCSRCPGLMSVEGASPVPSTDPVRTTGADTPGMRAASEAGVASGDAQRSETVTPSAGLQSAEGDHAESDALHDDLPYLPGTSGGGAGSAEEKGVIPAPAASGNMSPGSVAPGSGPSGVEDRPPSTFAQVDGYRGESGPAVPQADPRATEPSSSSPKLATSEEGAAAGRSAGAGETPLPPPPFGSASDPHRRATRLARALVSDIVVYHPDRRARSLRQGTLRQEFRDEIRKSWEEYANQVGGDFARETTYFRDALNELLANGQNIF